MTGSHLSASRYDHVQFSLSNSKSLWSYLTFKSAYKGSSEFDLGEIWISEWAMWGSFLTSGCLPSLAHSSPRTVGWTITTAAAISLLKFGTQDHSLRLQITSAPLPSAKLEQPSESLPGYVFYSGYSSDIIILRVSFSKDFFCKCACEKQVLFLPNTSERVQSVVC